MPLFAPNQKNSARRGKDDRRAISVSGVSAPGTPAASPTVPSGVRTGEAPFGCWNSPRRRESFWAAVACWSAIVFALMLGLSALGWFYSTGDDRAGAVAWWRHVVRTAPPQQQEAAVAAIVAARRIIDGQPLSDGEAGSTGYYAIMIDNMIDARPSSGLARSPLVIEAPAEGGITRFLAFYPAEDEVKNLGPIRSARPYYLDWVQEFDAVYAHVGGSPEALESLAASKIKDLNQFNWGKFFWRDTGRQAPHNVYTSTGLLAVAAVVRFSGRESRLPAGWLFKDEAVLADRPEQSADIAVDYSTPAYQAVWRYDREKNDYVRSQGDKEQADKDGTLIRAKNIVVQFCDVRILDAAGRRSIGTVGEGRALVVVDGRTRIATWKKTAVRDRTRYYDEQGREIEFNAGTTWVEVVPLGAKVAY